MLLPKLILHHARHGYDHVFSQLQVDDAIRWLRRQRVPLGPGTTALDLGCGSGTFGQRLMQAGCTVSFADAGDWLHADIPRAGFRRFDIDTQPLHTLGCYDLVICSNVLEHLRQPEPFLKSLAQLLEPAGHFYLSWTNWLSPWGGHDFSPFHYLGPRLGPRLYDRLVRKPRLLKPQENLFVTHIGRTLRLLRAQPELQILRVVPRYYPELWPVMKIPLLREVTAWNCAVLMRKR